MNNNGKVFSASVKNVLLSIIIMFVCFYITDNYIIHTQIYIYLSSQIPMFATFFSKIFSFILTVLANLLVYFPEILPFIRKKLLPVADYEGEWIEEFVGTERVISICRIYYNVAKRRHSYNGASFNETGLVVAEWKSNHISFAETNSVYQITFLGRGYKQVQNNVIHVNTTGVINFYSHNKKNGKGYYVDFPDTTNQNYVEQIPFSIKKITKSIKNKYNWKGKFEDVEDLQKFAIKYLQDSEK